MRYYLFSIRNVLIESKRLALLKDVCDGPPSGSGRRAVRLECRSAGFRRTIGPLDDELVLEHDQVTLACVVRHERLELCAEGIKEITRPGVERGGREKADPTQPRDDAVALGFSREVANFFNAGDEGAISGGHVSTGKVEA
jgi:hypothetical protein